MVAEKVDPKRLVFVDEMGANTSLAPLYAYSPKGERAHVRVPRNRGPNTTLLSSMTLSGMGPSLAVEGATTAGVFEAYVERVLAPSLKRGQIVIMDNLSAHKTDRVRELVEQRGCELLYLPPYSPDLNPIEEAFSKLKGFLRKAVLEAVRRWGWRSRRSAAKTLEASSSMPDGWWEELENYAGGEAFGAALIAVERDGTTQPGAGARRNRLPGGSIFRLLPAGSEFGPREVARVSFDAAGSPAPGQTILSGRTRRGIPARRADPRRHRRRREKSSRHAT